MEKSAKLRNKSNLVRAKYAHAHVLCKWFNSVDFVNYKAQKGNKYSLLNKKYVLQIQNIISMSEKSATCIITML